YNRRKSG
ncbi:Thiamine biosynthesis lipoprotein ApbE precursor, partial [Haemophilus influenzae]